jgi:hypothetical protein
MGLIAMAYPGTPLRRYAITDAATHRVQRWPSLMGAGKSFALTFRRIDDSERPVNSMTVWIFSRASGICAAATVCRCGWLILAGFGFILHLMEDGCDDS